MKLANKGVGLIILIGIIIIILFTLRKEFPPREPQSTYEPLYLNDTASVRKKVLTIFDSLGLTDDIEK